MDKLSIAILVLVGGFIGSFGTICIKLGVNRFKLRELFSRKVFYIGGFLYVLATLLYLLALSSGSLTFVYPLGSTSYIWIMFLSVEFLNEKMNKWKWIGVIGIIVGVILVGLGS